MKQFFKIFVVALAMVAWMPALAQKSVVNDVKKMIKKDEANIEKYRQAQKLIVPALSHIETKDNAETWFVAGKVMYSLYLNLELQEMMFGYESGAMEKCHALIDGYTYMQHALQLDSVQGKPKYSKDIWVIINGYIDDYNSAAMKQFIAKDYDWAYRLFDIFCELGPATKSAAEIAEARYYQMYAAQQMGRSTGSSLPDVLLKLVEAKQYDIANAFIDRASDDLKDEAIIYDMKGFVAEYQTGIDAAIPFYKKAVETNPSGDRLFYLGRAMCVKAMEIIDKNPDMSNADLKSQLRPVYEEALGYFNKAAALSPENTQVSRLIEDVKYRLEVMLNGALY